MDAVQVWFRCIATGTYLFLNESESNLPKLPFNSQQNGLIEGLGNYIIDLQYDIYTKIHM